MQYMIKLVASIFALLLAGLGVKFFLVNDIPALTLLCFVAFAIWLALEVIWRAKGGN